jgi:hypothetical protein
MKERNNKDQNRNKGKESSKSMQARHDGTSL